MSASTTFRWGSTETGWETLPEPVREQIVACGVRHWREVHQNVPSYNQTWRPLRPVIMTSSMFTALHEVSVRIAELILEACRRRAGTAGELRRALGVPAGRIRLLDDDEPLTSELLVSSRPDVLFSGGVPKFVEFNIDGALGGAFDSDNLAANFDAVYRAEGISEAAGIYRPPSAVDGRLRTVARWLGPAEDRRVVMVSDWSVGHAGPADQREFLNFLKPVRDRAALAGFELVPYWLDWLDADEQDRLLVDGQPFRTVLRMFVPDIPPPGPGVDALERVVRAGTVRCFTSATTWLLTNKLTLAWLWEDLPQLSEADRDLVRAHIPATALLTADQVPDAVARRSELVLKPSDGTNGRDVLLGPDATPEEWRAALERAAAGGAFLLQELVVGDLLPMDFVNMATGEVVSQGVPCCFGPYQFGGEQCGGETRIGFPGGGSVLNVAFGALVDGFALVEG
ncbi:hypothetical protein [Jatrophihabitans sp.]|uniref:hypothetical protein n=1 Tax=Jatrophihabitans sp. TaxID=1932789 RepID=UPI002C9AE3E6|nr:hypothetical protein [Jatrophihabitans sp.]